MVLSELPRSLRVIRTPWWIINRYFLLRMKWWVQKGYCCTWVKAGSTQMTVISMWVLCFCTLTNNYFALFLFLFCFVFKQATLPLGWPHMVREWEMGGSSGLPISNTHVIFKNLNCTSLKKQTNSETRCIDTLYRSIQRCLTISRHCTSLSPEQTGVPH